MSWVASVGDQGRPSRLWAARHRTIASMSLRHGMEDVSLPLKAAAMWDQGPPALVLGVLPSNDISLGSRSMWSHDPAAKILRRIANGWETIASPSLHLPIVSRAGPLSNPRLHSANLLRVHGPCVPRGTVIPRKDLAAQSQSVERAMTSRALAIRPDGEPRSTRLRTPSLALGELVQGAPAVSST
jgi:hypothetical protein